MKFGKPGSSKIVNLIKHGWNSRLQNRVMPSWWGPILVVTRSCSWVNFDSRVVAMDVLEREKRRLRDDQRAVQVSGRVKCCRRHAASAWHVTITVSR